MKTYTLDDVAVLVDKYDGDIVNFGTAEDAVSDVRIKEAEKTLGLQFTTSYKDFLKNYKGGEIGYEEAFITQVLRIILLVILCIKTYIIGNMVLRHQNSLSLAEQILVRHFILITLNFGMVSVRSILNFHLEIPSITRVIFMNFSVKELKSTQGRIHENLYLS